MITCQMQSAGFHWARHMHTERHAAGTASTAFISIRVRAAVHSSGYWVLLN